MHLTAVSGLTMRISTRHALLIESAETAALCNDAALHGHADG